MGFLDNSGDIILDAVLTDTGRMRLAKGDGSFKIQKFALGDDEIDYNLYDKNNASGSAYYDLEIMQTPILEAFTNNTSTMNSKIITITNSNLLYLPVIKLNTTVIGGLATQGVYYVTADSDTQTALADTAGTLYGNNTATSGGKWIRLDQGLNTTDISPSNGLSSDLTETSYMVELDSRLMNVADIDGNTASESFIDDDNIAAYVLALGKNPTFVESNTETNPITSTSSDVATAPDEVISGPRGTILKFKLAVSLDLINSNYYYDLLGGSTSSVPGATGTYRYIDTNIRVTGVTTGYRVDVPVRILKKTA